MDEALPVMVAFWPLIGIVFLSFGVALIVIELRKYMRSLTDGIISDLLNFASAWRENEIWEDRITNRSYDVGISSFERHTNEDVHRFTILGNKYAKWLLETDPEGNPTFGWDSEDRALKYAQLLGTHGYIMGHWHIYRDRKKKSKK